jgi:hypothetical protein
MIGQVGLPPDFLQEQNQSVLLHSNQSSTTNHRAFVSAADTNRAVHALCQESNFSKAVNAFYHGLNLVETLGLCIRARLLSGREGPNKNLGVRGCVRTGRETAGPSTTLRSGRDDKFFARKMAKNRQRNGSQQPNRIVIPTGA